MSKQCNVLVIANGHDEIEIISTALKYAMQPTITEALNSRRAIVLIGAIMYDLIIVCALYSKLSTDQFLKAVAEKQSSTPVIIFTSDEGPTEITYERFTFPVVRRANVSELLDMIAQVMGWSRQRRSMEDSKWH